MPLLTVILPVAGHLKTLLNQVGILVLFSALGWSQVQSTANVNESLETALLWVDATNGSDSNPGTQQLPLKTIGAAAGMATTNNLNNIGTQVNINPGIYRESLSLTGPAATAMPITFQAATPGSVVISGAVAYTNWTPSASNSNLYTAAWPNTWGFCDPDSGMGVPFEPLVVRRSETVFINGTPMTEVLSLAQMVFPGTFYVDETNSLIYVWPPAGIDMTAADVEVATLPNLLTITTFSNLVFRNLAFQYASSCHQLSAVTVDKASSNLIFDHDTFNWNSGQGLIFIRRSNLATVSNSTANHNGAAGFHAIQAKNILWQNVEASYNNWRGGQGAYYIWNTGGGHFFSDHEETVSGFTAIYNQTFGIHWDTDVQNLAISSLASMHNVSGVLLETAEGPISVDQSTFCNTQHAGLGEGGLIVRNTRNVSVTNSTFYNNGSSQLTSSGTAGGFMSNKNNWEMPTMPLGTLFTQNLTLANNSVQAVGSGQQDFRYLWVGPDGWTAFQSTLLSNNNTWWADSSTPFTIGTPTVVPPTTPVGFPGWQSAMGQDLTSSFSPLDLSSACVVTPDGPDWQLNADSGNLAPDATRAATFTLTGVDIGGFTGTATLAVDGIAAIPGATVQIPSTMSVPGTATVKYVSGPQTPPAIYTFTVLANVGNTTRTIALTVAPTLNFSVGSVPFKPQTIGTTSAPQTVAFANNTGKAITVSVAATPSSAFSQTNTCPVPPMTVTTCTISVTFSPQALGPSSGLLTVTPSTGQALSIALTGTGTGTTTTTVTPPNGSVSYGQPVAFTATVAGSPTGTTPSGTVTFKDGGVAFGNGATLNSGAVAASDSVSLTAGTHTITATYNGDANFGLSTSLPVTQIVGLGTSSVIVTPSSAVAVSGTPLTFTATITPATATGMVQFSIDGGNPAPATVTGGTALYSTALVLPGTHQITATYSGDANNSSSSSSTSIMITQIATGVVLTASDNPVQADATSGSASVTLTATINPANATGTVTFVDGTPLGDPVMVTNGVASTTVSLSVGAHNLVAMYGGDAVDAAMNGTLTEMVFNTPVGSAVAVTPQDTTKPAAGDTITFATVSQLGITTVITAATSDPTFPAPLPGQYQVGQPAQFSTLATTASTTGQIVVCLSYATYTYAQPSTLTLLHFDTTATPPAWTPTTGQTNTPNSTTICGSTSALGSFIIVQDDTTTMTLSSSANQPVFGQSVSFTATITPAVTVGSVQFTDGATPLGQADVTNGVATITTAQLTPGAHTITATYTDPSGFFVTQPSQLTIQVNQGTTTTTVTSSTSTVVFGQAATFTAIVTGGSSGTAPTGTVNFMDNGALIGSGSLSGSSASVTVSTLSGGTHSITAMYNGDANFAKSAVSGPFNETVTPATSSIGVTASASMVVFGTGITFSGAMTPSAATGNVNFYIDGNLAAMSGLTGGIASFSTATLAPGTHQVTASYVSDGNYANSNSVAVVVTIAQLSTAVTLTASSDPVQSDPIGGSASVTLTASVNPASAGGNVTFLDGTASLGDAVQLSNGVANLTVNLTAGVHNLVANYLGDTLDSQSSGSLIETIYNTPVGNNVAVTPETVKLPAAAAGDTITFASVTQLGVTTIDSTLITDPSFPAPLPANYQTAAQQMFFNLATTAAANGSISVCLSYAGVVYAQPATLTLLHYDPTATPPAWTATTGQTNTPATTTICGNSPALGSFIIVEDKTTTLGLTSSLNPATPGQSITFTAAITPTSATGSVQFSDGTTALGMANVVNGLASLSVSTLSVGQHGITATYTDSSVFFNTATGQLTETINASATTTTKLTSSIAAPVYGQPVTFTATVTGMPTTATPSGTVTFYDGATALGAGTLTGNNATLNLSTLAVGRHSIKATYNGDGVFPASSSSVVQETVGKAAASVALLSSSNPSSFGQNVTLTVTLTPTAPGSGTPTGSVTLKDGASTLATLSMTGGQAVFAISTLSIGAHPITASYAGDGNFNKSTSPTLQQTVSKSAAVVTLSSSQNPSVYGQSVTFTALVAAATGGSGIPTGTVTFKDGTVMLSKVNLSGGQANLTVSTTLTTGTHSISAAYNGDGTFANGASIVLPQVVNLATATIALTSTPNPSKFGQAVTFTALLTVSAGTGTPTGSVTFKDGGSTVGTGTLSGGKASFKSSTLASGTHAITAIYLGDTHFSGATSNALTQTVK